MHKLKQVVPAKDLSSSDLGPIKSSYALPSACLLFVGVALMAIPPLSEAETVRADHSVPHTHHASHKTRRTRTNSPTLEHSTRQPSMSSTVDPEAVGSHERSTMSSGGRQMPPGLNLDGHEAGATEATVLKFN